MSTGERPITVCFVGNPNCGKTTLFNAFTGAKLKVANWPGVTVERMEGETSYKGRKIRVIDTPGIYSLTSYTMEELVTRRCIEEDGVDVIVNVVDASSLERNLYLTMQLLELKKPVILALNMMDIIEERGMEIDLHRLPEMLGGIPVVPVSARKRTGLDVLMHAVVHHYEEGPQGVIVRYDREIEDRIQRVEDLLRKKYPDLTNLRWHAIKMLEYDKEVLKDHPVELEQIVPRSFEKEIINEKYDYVESVIKECLFNKEEKSHMTDQVDKILTHPILGIPAFFGIMALVFFLTFTVGDFLKGYFEQGLELLSRGVLSGLHSAGASDWVISLVVDGALAGVGGILTFLPNIFILFLALAFLEDSGYMARVAYVMNETMGLVGLSGRAFLPMLLGFGCTVPAVMATRALENQRDRLKTILITPFMSCSARLTIYVLLADMFFPKSAMLVAYSLYLVGVAMAILIALIVHRMTDDKTENALLIELPEYKIPNLRTVAIYVWEKIKDYLTKAGTTIFLASIILWFVICGKIRTDPCAGTKAGWSWKLADRGSIDLRNLRKGGRCLEYVRPLWDRQYQFCSWNGGTLRNPWGNRIHSSERLCAHGILPSLYTVYCDDRDDQERNTVLEMDIGDGHVPACACLVGGISCIPDRKPPVLIKKILKL